MTSWLLSSKQTWAPRQLHLKGPIEETFRETWKDVLEGSKKHQIYVVEPFVKDYPGTPSLHAIMELDSVSKKVPVLVEVKDEKSSEAKWKVHFAENPVSFETLSDLDGKKSGSLTSASMAEMKITVFDIDLKEGQKLNVNPGDLIKFVVPQDLPTKKGQNNNTQKSIGFVSKDSVNLLIIFCCL